MISAALVGVRGSLRTRVGCVCLKNLPKVSFTGLILYPWRWSSGSLANWSLIRIAI